MTNLKSIQAILNTPKTMMGAERRSLLITDDEKRTTAYHEAGYNCSGCYSRRDPVHKVTIIPRGRVPGLTQLLPSEDHHSYSKKKLVGQLAMIMGGGRRTSSF